MLEAVADLQIITFLSSKGRKKTTSFGPGGSLLLPDKMEDKIVRTMLIGTIFYNSTYDLDL